MVQRRCIIGAARQKIKAERECWDGECAALDISSTKMYITYD